MRATPGLPLDQASTDGEVGNVHGKPARVGRFGADAITDPL
jgi:hypothetical protein